MKSRTLKTIATAFVAVAMGMSMSTASADVLDTIKERGKLIVGVKADYIPYGYLDTSGAIIGIEPDLAKDVADKLGVDIEYVPVVSSNRMQFLEQGKIDLMIATMTDKPDRRKVVKIVDPNYYSSGTNILALKALGLKLKPTRRSKVEIVPHSYMTTALLSQKSRKMPGAIMRCHCKPSTTHLGA